MRRERGVVDKATGLPTDPAQRYSTLGDVFVEAGRLGHKTGKGWYAYPKEAGGKKASDPVAHALIAKHRAAVGAPPRFNPSPLPASAVVERCLFGLVNECFKVNECG